MSATRYAQTITDHGELLANIPAILGFYPKNSVLLTLFTFNEEHQTLRLGPVARLDLDKAVERLRDDAHGFAAWFDEINVVSSMVYIVADDIDDPHFDPRIQQLISFLGGTYSPVPDVLAVVHTAQISTDEPWQALYHSDYLDGHPLNGAISEITASAAMQHMINDTGQIPELDRDDMTALLDSTDHGLEDDVYADIVKDVETFTLSTPVQELQREYERACMGLDEPANPNAIRAGLKCFTAPKLRDPLIAALLEKPHRGFTFMQQLMRTVPLSWSTMRAQTTAVLAIMAHATEQSGLASNAARHAVQIDENERLSSLVAQVTVIGRGDNLVKTAYKGGREAHKKLFGFNQ